MQRKNEKNTVKQCGHIDFKTIPTTTARLELYLSNIGDGDAQHIAENYPSLTVLNLTNNSVTEKGAAALAACTHLTSLDLCANSIKDEGAKVLSTTLTLLSLMVGACEIKGEGVEALATNGTLRRLDISYNDINETAINALQKNTTLTELTMSYLTGLTSQSQIEIMTQVDKNKKSEITARNLFAFFTQLIFEQKEQQRLAVRRVF